MSQEQPTFQQMLGSGDIAEDQVPSLLNSKVIDSIAEQALSKVNTQWGRGIDWAL